MSTTTTIPAGTLVIAYAMRSQSKSGYRPFRTKVDLPSDIRFSRYQLHQPNTASAIATLDRVYKSDELTEEHVAHSYLKVPDKEWFTNEQRRLTRRRKKLERELKLLEDQENTFKSLPRP